MRSALPIDRLQVWNLARLLHAPGDRKRVMAIVAAYMDDSGTHRESPAIVVAGCVGLADHWDAFVPHWESILKAFGVTCHHNVDCAHFVGEYKGWDDKRRIDYYCNLVDAIGETSWFVLGGAILRKDYDEVIPEKYKKEIVVDPYYFPFQVCLETAISLLTPDKMEGEQISFVFDQQKGLSGWANRSFALMREFRDPNHILGSISFQDRRRFIPLQAADLIANEIYQDYGRGRPRSKSMDYLLQKVEPYVKHLPRDGLETIVREFNSKHEEIKRVLGLV